MKQNYDSRTLIVPDDSYTNLYVIFYDLNTGDMFDTTGAVSTTWADCAITGVAHGSNTGVILVTTPQIKWGTDIGVNIYDAASPADTDAVVKAVKYDPEINVTYSDSTPAANGRTRTR